MKNAHKLKRFKLGLEKFIFLNNDLTFAERSCEKHLRDERNRLNGSLNHSVYIYKSLLLRIALIR
jgi:hypothetical protein